MTILVNIGKSNVNEIIIFSSFPSGDKQHFPPGFLGDIEQTKGQCMFPGRFHNPTITG